MIEFKMKHRAALPEMLGYLPMFLSEDDPDSAQEQLDKNYRHGGGFSPFPGFKLLADQTLYYKGDPPVQLLAEARLHGKETIRIYEYAWVMILQDDGTWVLSRMD